jgi:hypothetical protein
MKFGRIISAGALRQIIAGVANVVAIVYLSTTFNIDDVVRYNTLMVFVFIASAIIGLPFYPAAYHYLALGKIKFQIVNAILLSAVLSAIVIGAGAIWLFNIIGYAAGIGEFSLLVSVVVASAVAAIPLGVSSYKIYNVLELTPSLVFLCSILLISKNYDQIILISTLSYVAKIAIFVKLYRKELRTGVVFDQVYLDSKVYGLKSGSVGAYQNISFRLSFFYLISFSSTRTSDFIAVIWPLAEKLMVVVQAANAVLFGVFKKAEILISDIKTIFIGLCVVLCFGFFLLYFSIVFWDLNFAGDDYVGVSSVAPLCLSLTFFQSIRILVSNYLNSTSGFIVIVKETTAYLLLQFLIYFVHSLGYVGADSAKYLLIFSFFCCVVFVFISGVKSISLKFK